MDILCLAGIAQQAQQSTHLAEGLNPVPPYCVLAELVSETVFEIRQLSVGDISLSPEYWRANY